MNDQFETANIKTNGVSLNVVQAGPGDGQLVILLHGFPEFCYGWRKQVPFLADTGYRVLVPDQRGYNLSEKPKKIAAYSLDELAADVIGLIDAAGHEKAVLVGHDWGGGVAWRTANKYPEHIEKLVILNMPHLAVMKQALRENKAQKKKSSYMKSFQIPWLPERKLRKHDWQNLSKSILGSSKMDTFSDNDMKRYREAWSQPGALTGMLNWYRAIPRIKLEKLDSPRITVPTLMIWGAQDEFLGREMAQPSIDLCDNGRLVFIEDATHWVHHEEPDRVNKLIKEFLAQSH